MRPPETKTVTTPAALARGSDVGGPNSSWRRTYWVVWIANLVTSIGMMSFLPFFPSLLAEMGVTDEGARSTWAGACFAAAPLSATISAPMWGALGDRFGRKVMVCRAMMAISLFVGMMGFASSPAQLLALRLCQGMFSGFIPPSITLVSIAAPADRQGRVAGNLGMALGVGGLVGPMLGGFLATWFGSRRAVFFVVGVLALVSTVIVWFGAEEDRSLRRTTETTEAERQSPLKRVGAAFRRMGSDIGEVLSVKNKTLKTTGNLNNQIGLPLTLLKLDKSHKICVSEIGMNDFGEISYLTGIAEPDIGAITNIGRAHLEKLITVEGVAKAKGELVEDFNSSNTFIVNTDDKHIRALAENIDCNQITYSLEGKEADIHAENIETGSLESIKFDLVIRGKSIPVKLKGIGTHNVMNALCASGIAFSLGYTLEDIRDGFENYRPVDMRLEVIETPQGFKIINDSYNANPDSMSSALRELSGLKNGNRIIAVLGDMLELGENRALEHKNIGEFIKTLNIDMVITYGDLSKNINESLGSLVANRHVDTHEQAAQVLMENAGDSDIVLLKGSRGMQMENTIKYLY